MTAVFAGPADTHDYRTDRQTDIPRYTLHATGRTLLTLLAYSTAAGSM